MGSITCQHHAPMAIAVHDAAVDTVLPAFFDGRTARPRHQPLQQGLNRFRAASRIQVRALWQMEVHPPQSGQGEQTVGPFCPPKVVDVGEPREMLFEREARGGQ